MTKAELHQKLTSADNLHKVLIESFSFLADTDGFTPVLKAIMGQVESVEVHDDGYGRAVYLHFPGDDEPKLIYGEFEDQDYSQWPESFKKIAASCMYIIFPDDGGWALQFGSDWFCLKALDGDEYEPGLILSSLSDLSNYWAYHPTAKNPQDEPLLCLALHENREIVGAVSCNIGSLFLNRMAEQMGSG